MLRLLKPDILTQKHARQMAALHAGGWSQDFFESILTSASVLGIGIFDPKSDLIGFCLSRWVIDEAEILTMIVDHANRQKGLGFLLLSKTWDDLQLKGVHTVFLEVFEGNAAAIGLYRKLGFKQIGVRENYYIDTERQPGNAIVLKLCTNI